MSNEIDPNKPLSRPDDHDRTASAKIENAVAAGHEDDQIQVLPFILAGGLIVGMVAVAYVLVTVVFDVAVLPSFEGKPDVNPLTAEANEAPIDQRLERLGRDTEDQQPRLEGLEVFDRPKEGEPDPVGTVFSGIPVKPKDNGDFYVSENLHPEDLRPDRVGQLKIAKWVNKDKGIASIPLSAAIDTILQKGLLKTQKQTFNPEAMPSVDRPSTSNAGRGSEEGIR